MYFFTSKTRFNIVEDYLRGISSTTLNRIYGIKGNATILSWVRKYKKYGYRGLVVSHTRKVYSFRYKLKVLNWMILYHKSYPETALHFSIGTMKAEMMGRHYLTEGQLVKAMKYWIWYYNNIRPKEKLGYEAPTEYRRLSVA